MSTEHALARYSRTAHRGASVVIRTYSTSFGWASRLLDASTRPHIENVYALVRIADELVDGPAERAGVDAVTRGRMLDELERETENALDIGYSTNVVVHAFAQTAREHRIGIELTRPFFASMRSDLTTRVYSADDLQDYIYGSAEVIGLMCLRVFLGDRTVDANALARLENGARRLGAAFQRINFLRDLADDHGSLGRTYFCDAVDGRISEVQKRAIVAAIRDDLSVAGATIPELPRGCRAAVFAAHALFDELTKRIDASSADEISTTRVSVPAAAKAGILARALVSRAKR